MHRIFVLIYVGMASALWSIGCAAQTKFDTPQEQPLFMAMSKKDPELIASVRAAQASLPYFRSLLVQIKKTDTPPLVKTYLSDGQGVWLWLALIKAESDGFFAEIFEAPPDIPSLRVGSKRFIPNEKVSDWMILEEGALHGGYSIRLQRKRLPEGERASFDRYVGVKSYETLPP